jgi:heme-degrading monooxygenase HmoA
MVRAFLYFDTNDGPAFAKALGAAAPALVAGKGYRGHQLLRGVEQPDRYALLVDWDSRDDHMAWMAVNESGFLGAIGPFIVAPPDIKHFAVAA